MPRCHGRERPLYRTSQLMSADGAHVVHGTVDREGRLIAADARLKQLQIQAGGVLGEILAIPPIASVARLARTLGILVSRGVVVGGRNSDTEIWVRAQPDGSEIRLSISGWTAHEASAEEPSQKQLRETGFAELEQEGKWVCDAELVITQLDDAIGELVDGKGWQGRKFTQIFRLLEGTEGALPMLEGLARREGFVGQQLEIRDAQGAGLTIYGNPVTGPDGQFAGYRGGFRWLSGNDFKVRPMVAGGNEDRGAIAMRLDAALREPLNRIIRSADAIGARKDGELLASYAAYAGDISAASRHLLGLVDDLGDLQAVEQIGFSTEAEPIDLADVARRATVLLSVRAADKGVRLDPPDRDETLFAIGDFRRSLQILVNLVGNAVRYSPSGSGVWIRLEEEGDLVAVIVADQGGGIAPSDHDRIFDKFERLDRTEPGGSGLGLYISRRLARAMGGDITVDSAPGQGARFAFTLPRRNAN